MFKKRLLSALMAFCMVFSALLELSILPVFATGNTTDSKDDDEETTIDYLTQAYYTADEKLATMELKVDKFGYQLYYHPTTAEVAVKNKLTGEVLFTNPYDAAKVGSASSDSIREQLLSQIILKYTDSQNTSFTMTSFVEAAQRGQIQVKNVKNGIRVEYTLGKQEARRLVPMLILKESFENNIKAFIDASENKSAIRRFNSFYGLKDPNSDETTDAMVREYNLLYPVTAKVNPETNQYYAVYVIDPVTTEREFNLLENDIKKFCPNYSYETLEEDHLNAEYEGNNEAPPLFRMSLEYYLDEDGVSVRMPANGIRFDQTAFQLNYIQVLPYMGAGSNDYTGYTMIPDGSGTLVRFEDVVAQGSVRYISGKIYGPDYTYYNPVGIQQEIMRLPVFGLVEDYSYQLDEDGNLHIPGVTDTTAAETTTAAPDTTAPESAAPETGDAETGDAETGETGTESETEAETVPEPVYTTVNAKRGFFAIIEEGASLATMYSSHGASITHKYNSVYTEFNPRPSDTYNLATVMSVGASGDWTVVSDRKYTGSYRIRYMMLTDVASRAEAGEDVSGMFDASYVGMAAAYKSQLEKNGTISLMEEEATKDTQIPLYIETLGVIGVLERFLSFPVTVQKPLTSFEDIKSMYNDLKEQGITNVNFRLTGFTNGGMTSAMPTKVKFEKAAGGNDGYTELIQYAKDNGFGIFPDFNYAYAMKDDWFDGFSYRTDAIRSIDNRYVRKKEYSPTLQYMTTTGLIAVSPSVFSDIFGSMKTYMDTLGVSGLSFSTLGSDLNTDFDKDDPYNREDNRELIEVVLSEIQEAYDNIMIDGGNAYALAYVDHVLNVTLDSSHYTYASETIPFFGLVFHGYLRFAGQPTNMAGDVNYEILKIIESGANPYFVLACQNIEEMKESTKLSKYYSISYENWKEDIGLVYNSLNTSLSDVMYATLVNHEFLIGERVKTPEEAAADEEAALKEEQAKAEAIQKAKDEAARVIRLTARLAKERLGLLKTTLDKAQATYDAALAKNTDFVENLLPAAQAAFDAAKVAYDDAILAAGEDEEAKAAAEALFKAATDAYNQVVTDAATAETALGKAETALTKAQTNYDNGEAAYTEAQEKLDALNNGGDPEDILAGEDAEDDKAEEEAPADDEEYVYTKYTSDNGMIVRVTYSNGISFIINYNNFDVEVAGYTVGAYDAIKFDANGAVVIESVRALTHADEAVAE